MNLTDIKLITQMIRNVRSDRLNRSLIGLTLKDVTEPIRHEDIRAFAKATKDENPVYNGTLPLVPPLFISRLVIPLLKEMGCHKGLGLNFLRMVHAGQEILWHKPLKAGERLKIKITLADIYDTPAGEMIRITSQGYRYRQLMVESITGLIIRKKQKTGTSKAGRTESKPEIFRLEIRTDRDQPLDYARASRDNNFIHTSRPLARLAGLPGTIMHGACVMAMICSALTAKAAGGDITRLSGMGGRFSGPVIPGQKLTLVGHAALNCGEIPFTVLNPSGKPVFKDGLFRFKVPRGHKCPKVRNEE